MTTSRTTSPPRPAAAAAARLSATGLGIGGLGLASAAFVLVRLVDGWRVRPEPGVHQLAVLGQTFSYPAANLGAVVILVLALPALVAALMTAAGAAREIWASWRAGRRLAGLCQARIGDALMLPDPDPRSFCAGLLRPRIYITTGAVSILDDAALGAVLAHERHHARRRDPLRLAAARVLARALFYLPGLGDLASRQQALAELSADESAMAAGPERKAGLARAMLAFADAATCGQEVGFDVTRVDYVLGEEPSWSFPLVLVIGAAAVIASLIAITQLAGEVASGSATLAPPIISARPCVIVLATISTALAALSVRAYRGRAHRMYRHER